MTGGKKGGKADDAATAGATGKSSEGGKFPERNVLSSYTNPLSVKAKAPFRVRLVVSM